jgi:A/G-specific adenine glycosylase
MGRQDWKAEKIVRVRERLLAWYERNRRDLPWRRNQNPYAIWVSEVMLQQTRVAVVVERYQRFMARFPTLVSLALAPVEEVLALWSGLGYYRRARMLHKAAQFVADHNQGNLPPSAEKLRLLPGIGAYTAAAIASIANGERIAVVDGNVERVLCRMEGWDAGDKTVRHRVEELAAELVCPQRARLSACPAIRNAGSARWPPTARLRASTQPRRGRRCTAARLPTRSQCATGSWLATSIARCSWSSDRPR